MYYLHYASGAESRPVGVRSQPSSDGARTGSAVWPNDVICCVDVLVVGAEEWAVLEDGGGYVNVRHPATGARLLRVVSEAAAADIWRSAAGGGGGEPSGLAASLADVSARQRRVDEDIRAARRQLELSRRELAEMRRLADALRRERGATEPPPPARATPPPRPAREARASSAPSAATPAAARRRRPASPPDASPPDASPPPPAASPSPRDAGGDGWDDGPLDAHLHEDDDAWERIWDHASGAFYFWHKATNRVTWTDPASATAPPSPAPDDERSHRPTAASLARCRPEGAPRKQYVHCCEVRHRSDADRGPSQLLEGAPDPLVLSAHDFEHARFRRPLQSPATGAYETGMFGPPSPRRRVVARKIVGPQLGAAARAAGRDAVHASPAFANPRSRFKPMFHRLDDGAPIAEPRTPRYTA